jgi:hypothetical protein
MAIDPLRRAVSMPLVVYLSTALILLISFQITRGIENVNFYTLGRDPLEGADRLPIYVGLFTNIEILLWCITATACTITSVYLRDLCCEGRIAGMLFGFGILIYVLMLDDFFQLHERANKELKQAELFISGAYLISTLYLVVRFWRVLLTTRYGILAVAFACFAASMTIDLMSDYTEYKIAYGAALEDAFKALGIVGFSTYFISLCLAEFRSAIGRYRVQP